MRIEWRDESKHPCAAAYTLAEVMVAVLVLAVISTAFYGGLSFGFSVVESSREELRATQILMQKVEGLRLISWDNLQNITFQEVYDPLGLSNNSGGLVYTGTIVTNADSSIPNSSSYLPNMRLVTVTVNWTNYNGSKRIVQTRQMQTQVARYGLQNYVYGVKP
ncbi:MAG TPA: prepilin-type N-terminal cleavage/methylation domain-containing protein [Verrucomicrobiae bacterium]|nr:prepilin-type N-terminal cleavage/methylation domain-containing protein [Verrucomicrobiae bacterium]